jgi:putative transposase
MPEHVHLLISEPETGTPSTVMQVLTQRFAKSVLQGRRRHWPDTQQQQQQQQQLWNDEEPRHIWQARFYDFNVWSKRKRIEKLRYMHENPVRRGLVLEAGQWAWSSFRDYAYDEPARVMLNQWPAAVLKKTA